MTNDFLTTLLKALKKELTKTQTPDEMFLLSKTNHTCPEGTFVLARLHDTLSVVGKFDQFDLKLLRTKDEQNKIKWIADYRNNSGRVADLRMNVGDIKELDKELDVLIAQLTPL